MLLPLALQDCQTREQEVSPDKSIEKVLAQEDPKLAHGLSLIQSKASKNGRVEKSQIDELLLDSALRKFDKNTGSTNYSLLLYKNLPYSIGNLVVAEKNGNYLAFIVEYINANPKGGWDLAKFQGKMVLTSIDGKSKKTVDINPQQSKNGRTDASICSTTVTKVTVSSVYGSYTYYETEFGCVFIDIDNFGDVGSGSYKSQPGDTPVSDSGNGVSSEPTYLELPGVDKTAVNVNALMKCFGQNDNNASYKLTLFVEEPSPGSDDQKVGKNVGHTFVGLTKIVNGQETTQYVGFYPINKSLTYPIESKIVNNQQTEWTASVTFDLDAHAFDDAIYAAKINSGKDYHISQYNCTTYALDICDAAGLSLPKNSSEFPYGYGNGYSPGKLGYDLRNSGNVSNGVKNFSGGTTPNGKGPCQ